MNIILKDLKESFKSTSTILHFLFLSSIFTAAMVSFFLYSSFILMGVKPDLTLLFSIFLTFLAIYNINNLTDKEEDSINQPERANYTKDNENLILFLSILSYFIAILLGFYVNYLTVPAILFPFIVGLLYSIQIHPKIPRMKEIVGVKSFMVAISFVMITVIPVIFLNRVDAIIILLFYFFFAKIFINTIIFDIRDIEGDKKNNIKTIPVAIGKSSTKKLLFAINSSLILWIVVFIYLDLFTPYLPVLIFSIFYGYWYIHYFCNTEKAPKFLINLLVDGEWMFIAILCFIITNI